MFGAGAQTIGPQLAEALGVPFIGQAISSEELEGADQGRLDDNPLTRLLAVLGRTGYTADAGVFSGPQREREAAEGIARVREACENGGVILGRNATIILADLPNALHVKLDAPPEDRIARAMAETGIDVHQARSRQAREDRVRAELSLRLHNWDPRENDRFDLVLNTSHLKDHEVLAMILAAYRVKMGERG